jgi:hypothetical protein
MGTISGPSLSLAQAELNAASTKIDADTFQLDGDAIAFDQKAFRVWRGKLGNYEASVHFQKLAWVWS